MPIRGATLETTAWAPSSTRCGQRKALRERDHRRAGALLGEAQQVRRTDPTRPGERLVIVTGRAERAAPGLQRPDQLALGEAAVLPVVDERHRKARRKALARRRIAAQQRRPL